MKISNFQNWILYEFSLNARVLKADPPVQENTFGTRRFLKKLLPEANSDGKCRRGGSSTLPLVNPVGVNRDFDVRMSKGWDKAKRAVGGTIDSVRKLGDDAGVAVKDLALKGVKNLLSGRPLWQSEEKE